VGSDSSKLALLAVASDAKQETRCNAMRGACVQFTIWFESKVIYV